jgi:uracil-DNA glycosylase
MNKIHKSWKPLFDNYYFNISEIYASENDGIEIYPPRDQLFRVFEMDVEEIRVVLLGQDPYHRKGQAHGLSFSVPNGIAIPPSLKNIYKELKRCFPERNYEFTHGNLENWFYREKIFLLNASLSVIKALPGSQMSIWEDFTNDVIKFISDKNKNCIYLLLGNFAKYRSKFIQNKEKIVEEVHPSPLARNFIGSDVFKRVEAVLGEKIDWNN